jgi:hypothetical protein
MQPLPMGARSDAQHRKHVFEKVNGFKDGIENIVIVCRRNGRQQKVGAGDRRSKGQIRRASNGRTPQWKLLTSAGGIISTQRRCHVMSAHS